MTNIYIDDPVITGNEIALGRPAQDLLRSMTFLSSLQQEYEKKLGYPTNRRKRARIAQKLRDIKARLAGVKEELRGGVCG